jgi:HD-like signal output (HDOD) protein
MDDSKAALVLRHIDRMPSLSPTVAKIMQVANDPTSSANDLNKVISLDPVLAAKVLKLVNSAYFGFSDKVTSTVRAIVVLGLNTIKNLALSTAALETMSMKGQSAMNMDEFWKHVLGVGVTAKLIARRIGVNKNFLEDYFLAGLMHDMGKIVLNRLNPVGYKKVITVCAEKGVDLQLVESRVFGINHAEIGGLLAEKWGLQNSLREAMAFHHYPDQASPENRQLVLAIYISNAFTKVHSVGVSGNTYIQELGEQGWADLGMRPEALQEMAGMLVEGVERASIFLQTAG